FLTGDGINDTTMTFTGTLTDINIALHNLVFKPFSGFYGAASIQITTNDTGWSGGGGAQSDSDIIDITVDPLNPEVLNVDTAAADGLYKMGDTITIAVTFDQLVFVDTSLGV